MCFIHIPCVFENLHLLWMDIWLHTHTVTVIDVSPDLGELSEILGDVSVQQVCKPCHYAIVEAVVPFKLHPTSMTYIYKVCEHLHLLWMGIWLYTHIIIATDYVFPRFRRVG
jgi:hypothetical protein